MNDAAARETVLVRAIETTDASHLVKQIRRQSA